MTKTFFQKLTCSTPGVSPDAMQAALLRHEQEV